MNKQSNDLAETPQPLDEPSIMPLPVKREHKKPLSHPKPGWWPTAAAARLALGIRVRDNITSVAAQLEYNVDNNTVAHIGTCVTAIEKLEAYRMVMLSHAQGYTEDLDFAYNGPANVNQLVIKLDANATAALGPTTANLNLFGGLLGWLMALESTLNQIPAYRDNQQFGIALGFIKDPAAPSTLALHIQTPVIKRSELIDNTPGIFWHKGSNDGVVVEWKEEAADAHWHPALTAVTSPTLLPIPGGNHDRVVQVRIRYYKGNQQVGNWSDAVKVLVPAAEQVG